MQLQKINIEIFRKELLEEYNKIFPSNERKPYFLLKKCMDKGYGEIYKILDNKLLVGFLITNCVQPGGYVQLDYFAIFDEFRNKGYGSECIKKLKDIYSNNKGIFIEIEKEGLGKTDKENILREKRAKFYERLNFKKLDFDILLYQVIYSPYILECSENLATTSQDKIIEEILEIYNKVSGFDKIKKNCKIKKGR